MASFRSEWQVSRECGRECFERGDYIGALQAFRETLQSGRRSSAFPRMSVQDQQYTLSNIIACRLKIGGVEQARAAVQEAQECIALNPQWSKAHVRLAAAYLCLGECEGTADNAHHNRYSNDACNALQTALRYDPQNRTARQMLIQELRHRDHPSATPASSDVRTTLPSEERDPPVNPDYIPPFSSRNYTTNDYLDGDDANNSNGAEATGDVDNPVVSILSRLRNWKQRIQVWYLALSSDQRNALHIGLILLLLYIGFGGRFGFESSSSPRHRKMKGNYGHDNVYEQYRREKQKPTSYGYNNYQYDERSRRMNDHSSFHDPYHHPSPHTTWRSSPEVTGLVYMGIMLAAVYVGHLNGISPWQALMLLRMLQGGGGGGVWYHHYGGGGRRAWGRRRW